MWHWMAFTGFESFWGLAVYVWIALTLHIIATKTGTRKAWLAWIPIANLYLMCKVAGMSGWLTILFFIPPGNIILVIIVWMEIARARNKPPWLGILIIIPIVNLIIMGILALSETTGVNNMNPVIPELPPTQRRQISKLAIASLVLGILSILSFFLFPTTNIRTPLIYESLLYAVPSIIALAFGITAILEVRRLSNLKGMGLAMTGIVLASPQLMFGIGAIFMVVTH